MAVLEQLATADGSTAPPARGYSIAPGTVTSNLDPLGEGLVQVHIPSTPEIDPWAHVVSVGAGMGRGLCWIPQIGDQVLVAYRENDERDAYVLGGLWSTIDRPPLLLPTDFLVKRVIKTGLAGGLGHEVEFDDALQSIKITTSTKQKITVDPLTIELKNTAGTLTITMDNATQSVAIQAAAKISLKAAQIQIEGVTIDLKGGTINIQATGPCSVTGLPIRLN